MSKNKKPQLLHVLAKEAANVREVEPDGSVLTHVRFVGKTFNSVTNEFEVLPDGVVVPYSARIVNELKNKTLLPVDDVTAAIAGVL